MSVRLLDCSLWDVRRFEVISAREGTLDQAAKDRGDEASVYRILWKADIALGGGRLMTNGVSRRCQLAEPRVRPTLAGTACHCCCAQQSHQ